MSLLSPQLAAFLAIVKRQTVHGASQDLGITQTGVTQRIKALEAQLSAKLIYSIKSWHDAHSRGAGAPSVLQCG